MPDTQERALGILERMEALLATPRQWTQDVYQRFVWSTPPVPAYCLTGAFGMASMGSITLRGLPPTSLPEDAATAYKALVDAIDSEDPANNGILWFYNDAPGRKHSEILALIASAKEIVRKEMSDV